VIKPVLLWTAVRGVCMSTGDGDSDQVVHRLHQVTAGHLWALRSLSAIIRRQNQWRHSSVSVYYLYL